MYSLENHLIIYLVACQLGVTIFYVVSIKFQCNFIFLVCVYNGRSIYIEVMKLTNCLLVTCLQFRKLELFVGNHTMFGIYDFYTCSLGVMPASSCFMFIHRLKCSKSNNQDKALMTFILFVYYEDLWQHPSHYYVLAKKKWGHHDHDVTCLLWGIVTMQKQQVLHKC
jgi:hypothetical protein